MTGNIDKVFVMSFVGLPWLLSSFLLMFFISAFIRSLFVAESNKLCKFAKNKE